MGSRDDFLGAYDLVRSGRARVHVDTRVPARRDARRPRAARGGRAARQDRPFDSLTDRAAGNPGERLKPLSMRDPVSRGLALAALVVAALGFTGVGEAVRSAVLPAGSVGTAQLRQRGHGRQDPLRRRHRGGHQERDAEGRRPRAGNDSRRPRVRRPPRDQGPDGPRRGAAPDPVRHRPGAGRRRRWLPLDDDHRLHGQRLLRQPDQLGPGERHECRRRPRPGDRLDHHRPQLGRQEAPRRLRDLRLHADARRAGQGRVELPQPPTPWLRLSRNRG